MKQERPANAVFMILVATVISAVSTVILVWAAGKGFWFPDGASTVAADVDFLFDFITAICIFFFIMVSFLMVWFVVKFKGTNTTKATSDVTHNTPLELTWTIIPLILVIAIFYVGMEGYLNLRQAPVGAYEVQVTGARWSWNFRHRNGLNESNVLLVPANRPVKLIMDSSDVLHAAYIPAFRVKQDIVPGRITTLWFQATTPGKYDLFCAEYCGKDHSQMHAVVEVMEESAFQAELQRRFDIIDKLALVDYPQYAIDRIYPRCKSCHSLDENVTVTAPSWRGLWAKLEKGEELFTDGSKLADHVGDGKLFASPEDYVRRSILDPQQKIVMNYTGSMPTFIGQLKDKEIQAVIELFKHLDEFDNNGKRIKPAPGAPAGETGDGGAATGNPGAMVPTQSNQQGSTT